MKTLLGNRYAHILGHPMCHGVWLTRSKQAALQFLTLVCPFLCSLYKPGGVGGGGGDNFSIPQKKSKIFQGPSEKCVEKLHSHPAWVPVGSGW